MSHPRRDTHKPAPKSLPLRISLTANLVFACIIAGEAFLLLWGHR